MRADLGVQVVSIRNPYLVRTSGTSTLRSFRLETISPEVISLARSMRIPWSTTIRSCFLHVLWERSPASSRRGAIPWRCVDSPLSLIRSYRVLGHCAGNRIPRQEAGALDDAALASASATTSSGESVGLLSSVHRAKSTGCPFPLCTRRNNGYPRCLWMVSWTHQTSDITDQWNSGKTVIVSNPSICDSERTR